MLWKTWVLMVFVQVFIIQTNCSVNNIANDTTTSPPTESEDERNTTIVRPSTVTKEYDSGYTDDPITSTPTSKQNESTTISTTTENPTTSLTTLTESATSTTTISTTTTIPPTTSTFRPTIKPRPPESCPNKCTKTDSAGNIWEVCAGDTGVADCNRTVPNSAGQVIWECSLSGQFLTEQPNYSMCRTPWLNDFVDEAGKINSTVSAVTYLRQLKYEMSSNKPKESSYFGHEIETLNQILRTVTKAMSDLRLNSDQFMHVATSTMGVAERLISREQPWHHLESNSRSKLATNLLQTIEDTSLQLTNMVELQSSVGNVSATNIFYQDLLAGSQFTVTSLAYTRSTNGLDNLHYPWGVKDDSVVKLPPGWVSLVKGEIIECVGILLDPNYASLMMPGQFKKLGLDSDEEKKKVLNGKIMSFTIASNATESRGEKVDLDFKGQGVQIVFKQDLESWGDEVFDVPRKLRSDEKPKAVRGTAQCVFWDTKNLQWSQEGCKIISSTTSETTCECSHLTSFAILMDVHNYKGKNLGLEILTLILCPISILCLIVTIIIISRIRLARSERMSITLHLSICLTIGNLLVLLVLDRGYFNLNRDMCTASGIVTHYIFLAAFGWMASQGAHLHHMVVNVFSYAKSPLVIFKVISYGFPLIVIGITILAGYLSGDNPYGGEVVCWLNGPYIWGFMGPVIIIVLINASILSLSLWKSFLIRDRSIPAESRRRVSKHRFWIRGSFALTILLGITWITGFLMMVPEIPGLVAAYCFIILNASQGIFIFTFDCFLNEKVRQGIHRQYGRYLPVTLNSWLKNTSSSCNRTENTEIKSSRFRTPKKTLSTSESNTTGSTSTNGDVSPPATPPRQMMTPPSPELL